MLRFSLRPLLRFASKSHLTEAATGHHHHDGQACSHDHSHDHGSHTDHHDHHDEHGHKSHKPIPEGSWHRHSDDEDHYYYYNKFGPFHSNTLANQLRSADEHNIPEEDEYRNTIQGYIRMTDSAVDKINTSRGLLEFFSIFFVFLVVLYMTQTRSHIDNMAITKKIGDAHVTAQEVEDFIEELKKKRKA